MKTIHPAYNKTTKITCIGCGAVHEVGSTGENLSVEICSNCHPHYTGKAEVLVDTGNTIKKFQARLSGANPNAVIKKRKKVQQRKSPTQEVGKSPALTLRDMMKQLS